VRNYNHKIVLDGAKIMAQIWKTDLISNDERCIGYMACVLLPPADEKTWYEISN